MADVLGRAGFAVTGETGSALVAESSGSSFSIWSTPLSRPVASVAEEEGWDELGEAEGVTVYGDRDVWRWWAAQDQLLWLQAGPSADARAPRLAELGPLIRESRELAPPAAG